MTGPQPLPKWVFHRVWFSALSFNFQYPLISLTSFSSCLHLIPLLPFTSILSCIFPSVSRFKRQFLCTVWPIQLAFLLFIVCGISSLAVCNIYFSHNQSSWSPSLSSTTFHNLSGVSDLLAEVSKFPHRTKLYSKCSTSPASSWNVSPPGSPLAH